MKSLENKVNINPADSDFPFGDVRDKTTGIAGTKWNREMMSDYIQFFHKMFSESGLTYNEQLDNEYSGWQLYEAFRKITRPYKVYSGLISQSGTNDPVVTVLGLNDIGSIVWTRSTTGTYFGTLSGAFPVSKTWVSINQNVQTVSGLDAPNCVILRGSDNNVSIASLLGDTISDSQLVNIPFEIRVYD